MTTLTRVLVLDEPGSHVLLTSRHRFIVGKWVWELPGGYVDDDEDGAAAAVRETEEETGWRPRGVSFMPSYQPMIGNADFPQDLYLARGADLVRDPAADETAAVRWIPLDEAAAMISPRVRRYVRRNGPHSDKSAKDDDLSHDHDSWSYAHAATIRAS